MFGFTFSKSKLPEERELSREEMLGPETGFTFSKSKLPEERELSREEMLGPETGFTFSKSKLPELSYKEMDWKHKIPFDFPDELTQEEISIVVETIESQIDVVDINYIISVLNFLYNNANSKMKDRIHDLYQKIKVRLKGERRKPIHDIKNRIPTFDDFLISKGKPFYCIMYHPEEDVLMGVINEYASIKGLDPIISEITKNRVLSKLIQEWQFGFQINKSLIKSQKITEMVSSVPPLSEPITLYRTYRKGITPAPDMGDINFQYGIRSYSMSLRFCQYFGEKDSVYSRVDVMPGIHVAPMFDYGRDTQPSQFEIALLPNARLHCFPNEIYEKVPTPSPNLNFVKFSYEMNPMRPAVDYFFVVSVPGTTFNYTPYQSSTITIKGGGIKKISDKYLVHGSMSIHEKMDKIMNLHKRKTRRRGKTRKYKVWNF